MRSPDGKRHRIYAIENTSGFGAHAWAWYKACKKIHQYAASKDIAIDNLVKRLKSKGWREDF